MKIKEKEEMVNNLEASGNKEEHYCHLIIIVDRKKHTKKQVLKAFEEYTETDGENDLKNPYPERKIIPLKLPKNYVRIV